MVNTLKLQNFRSYERKEFSFELRNVVEGGNGSGKSNLIEAIYLLATGKSFRADRDEEMIRYGQGIAHIQATITNDQETKLNVVLAERKGFEVNGIPRRMMDAVGKLRAVMFGPQDMTLVTGSPGGRRRYLDFVISQTDREYRRNLVSYEKGLRQRNRLLDLIREGQAARNQLFFWDKLLIKNGDYIIRKRQEFLDQTGFLYDQSIISETRLKQYETEEVAAATTLVGPHRDDFVFIRDGRDVSKFGSRGEQRMAVWWLKQCEIKYLGSEPVMLLDDIFSELDHKHREEVVMLVRNYPGQVIMTTTERQLVPDLEGSKIVEL